MDHMVTEIGTCFNCHTGAFRCTLALFANTPALLMGNISSNLGNNKYLFFHLDSQKVNELTSCSLQTNNLSF